MKKLIAAILCLIMAAGTAAGCGSDPAPSNDEGNEKLSVVATIFPQYDWIKEILGDKADSVELTLLLDNGVDLHSYKPTADDIVKISNCDMFVYVGGESDEWVEDVLKTANNKKLIAVDLLEVLGDKVKEEEVKEGMEAGHDHEHGEGEEHEEEDPEYDEHVWLSLKHAAFLCEHIAGKLGQLDPANAAAYASNAAAYTAKLAALDGEYAAAVNAAPVRTLLFADRFPFRYLVDDYGLDYYAAFAGCSAESEASFETIMFLAGKVDELGLTAIMQIESADGSIARTVKESTKTKDQRVLTLDSLQSVTSASAAGGTTYLSVMKENLNVLKDALK